MKVMISDCVVAAGITLFVVATCHCADTDDHTQPSRESLHAIAEGFLSHRESFEFLSCEFDATLGRAKSIEQALHGDVGDSPIVSRVQWVIDGKLMLYEEKCASSIFKEAEADARKSGETKFTVPLTSSAILTDSAWKMVYSPSMEVANIIDPEHAGPGYSLSPFSGGMMGECEVYSPGNLLKECLAGKYVCRSVTAEELDGHNMVMIVITIGRPPNGVTIKYYLNPEQGFLPVRGSVYSSAGTETTRVYWTDNRKVSDNRWFPWRVVRVTMNPNNADYGVKIIQVASLNVDTRPPRGAFEVTVPEQTGICDPYVRLSGLKMKADRIIGIDDLPKLHQECLAQVSIRQARLSEMAHSKERNMWTFGIVTCLIAGAIVSVVLYRVWYSQRQQAV
jgi:hypothetical protein